MTHPTKLKRFKALTKDIRVCARYRAWKKAVTERDKGLCNICWAPGEHVDHVPSFGSLLRKYNVRTVQDANACEALWDLSVGRLLCRKCHAEQPTTPRGMKLKWLRDTVPDFDLEEWAQSVDICDTLGRDHGK